MAIDPKDVLSDLLERLKQDSIAAARAGIKNATTLALEAEQLIQPLLKLPNAKMLSGLESVAAGMEFGLAKIAEDAARNYFRTVISMAIGYAGTLLRKNHND